MTIMELAQNWIENADDTPTRISVERAAEYIGWMDPDSDLPEDLTPEAFADAWNRIIGDRSAEAQEIVDAGNYAAAVSLMDDDIREELSLEIAPCSEREFLAAYMQRHEEKYGEIFTV